MSDQLPSCMMPDGAAPCQGYAELLDESDGLRAELEQIKNPWIIVEDELPEEDEIIYGLQYGEEVFFCVLIEDATEYELEDLQSASFFEPIITTFKVGATGELTSPFFQIEEDLENVRVTHWMPIPKLEGEG